MILFTVCSKLIDPILKLMVPLRIEISRIRSPVRTRVGLNSKPSRPCLGAIHFPVQCVLGLCPGGKATGAWRRTTYLYFEAKLSMSGAIPPLPLCLFAANEDFNFYLHFMNHQNYSHSNENRYSRLWNRHRGTSQSVWARHGFGLLLLLVLYYLCLVSMLVTLYLSVIIST